MRARIYYIRNSVHYIVFSFSSNCLDSTHIEKACFWLIDAMLEYTMTGHVSNLLKSLNRTPYLEFPGEDFICFINIDSC